MFMRGWGGRARRGLGLAALVAILGTALPAPAAAADALLFRLFLRDGSTVVSYGDFTRVADRVVFSIPIGALDAPSPLLRLVSLAESLVDWDRTDQYAAAVRARRYAETQGAADFDALSVEVARALWEVSTVKDPARALALASEARRRLTAWPSAHYGYRASDVAQLANLLDEAVGDLRVAAGQPRYDLALVATAESVPRDVPALPPPTLRESIEQAFSLASALTDPAERVSLLQDVVASVPDGEASSVWAASLKARATAELFVERRTDTRYQDLVARTIAAADRHAQRANVGAIDGLIRSVLKADDKLGRLRPQTTAALLATLDGRLDAARRLRLARDTWLVRQRGVLDYQRRIRAAVDRLRRSTTGLEQIRQLAGPVPDALNPLARRVLDAWQELKAIQPPAEAEAAHGNLVSAASMAARAVAARRLAVTATDMGAAWEASSAAAGALLFFERAQDDLKKLNVPPTL